MNKTKIIFIETTSKEYNQINIQEIQQYHTYKAADFIYLVKDIQ